MLFSAVLRTLETAYKFVIEKTLNNYAEIPDAVKQARKDALADRAANKSTDVLDTYKYVEEDPSHTNDSMKYPWVLVKTTEGDNVSYEYVGGKNAIVTLAEMEKEHKALSKVFAGCKKTDDGGI